MTVKYQLLSAVSFKKEIFKITPKANYLLSDYLGNDLSKISNELTKLQLVLGNENMITPELIQENIGISKDYNNFELQNAIAQLNHEKSVSNCTLFFGNPNQHPMVVTVVLLYIIFFKIDDLTYRF